MSIKFKTIQKSEPCVSGGGARKYYAAPVMNGELGIDLTTINLIIP
ncbi:MAG: hypothetical protein LBS09_09895 [Bacteroidales bacterium]|jgi:hypothetical protein|nr:hypothetical protein [Bacteroidales bacterium]